MMKKLIVLLAALFLAPICARAEVALDENALFADMPCTWAQGYEPVIQGNNLVLHVPVEATGTEKITVTLHAADMTLSPLKKQDVTATVQRQEGGYGATLRTSLMKGRTNGDYPCTLIISQGEDRVEQPFTLRIRDGKMPEAARPIISNLDAALNVGEEAMLTMTLANCSPYADITDLRMTLTDPAGDILPVDTNILPLGDIPAGGSAVVNVPLTVRPSASVTLHTLQISLSWTALDAAATWQETFTLPVNQLIRLEQGGAQLAPTILQGELASLTLPLMNMGRGEIRNAMVTLDMPGVVENQSVLVGTIAPGESKTARLTFTPGKDTLGHHAGTLLVSAEDAYGNSTSFALPVETEVEPAPALKVNVQTDEGKDKEGSKWTVPVLAAGCGMLLLALMVQGMLLRKKIRRMEEERL